MGQISVTIQNRTYRLSCDDGEEERLAELAAHVRAKADGLIAEHGRIGDEHLMLMSAILVADELWDLRAAAKAPPAVAREKKPAASTPATGEAADQQSAAAVAPQKSVAASG